jgi:phosphoribosyl 1,2-cyclic phosphodiesterase
MRVHFWGTRGSLPASYTAEAIRTKILAALKAASRLNLRTDDEIERFLRDGLTSGALPFSALGSYGSNTSCVQIGDSEEEYLLCDAGTGLRDFGNHALQSAAQEGGPKGKTFNIFMSHLHWDHIQGFPFFTPAYVAGNRVRIYGFHKELEQAFTTQQEYPYFPVPLRSMNADIEFIVLEEGKEYQVAGFTIKGVRQNHPGGSYGYRFEKDGKSVVYSTDAEHKAEAYERDYLFLDFFRNADLLIFDAQYSFFDAITVKENWGHSSNIVAVELSVKSGVKHLCIYHNEPTLDDERLGQFLEDTRTYLRIYAEDYPLKIDLAYDGLEIEL